MKPTGDAALVAWVIFCALLSVAWIGALIWLVVALVGWLGRH